MDKIFQPIEGPTKIGMVKQFIENQRAKRLTCRICLELDHKLQMISPCACKGTSRYVHKSCLSKWRAIEGASRFRCEICHSHYEFCRSWLKAGLIRIGCWIAILVYGYITVLLSQWCLSWFGLTPSISRLAATREISFLSPYLDPFFEHVSIGPVCLFISPCVSLKKNRRGFTTFAKCLLVWALTHYFSFLSFSIASLSDILYVVFTTYGTLRMIRHSFAAALTLAPTVAVVLVDLHRLRAD